jgi:hypothetical protein
VPGPFSMAIEGTADEQDSTSNPTPPRCNLLRRRSGLRTSDEY